MSAQHPVVWFEVMGDKPKQLQGFYGDLFGWKLNGDNPMGYGLVEKQGGEGIPGGVGSRGGVFNHRITFYVETDDLKASLERATQLGGKVVTPPTPVADMELALFQDPEGNVVGLVQPNCA